MYYNLEGTENKASTFDYKLCVDDGYILKN